MKWLLLLIAFGFAYASDAQITDDFSDGDFTSNPTWIGDQSKFEVDSNKQLHLNDTVADIAYLSSADTLMNNIEWEFFFKMDFFP